MSMQYNHASLVPVLGWLQGGGKVASNTRTNAGRANAGRADTHTLRRVVVGNAFFNVAVCVLNVTPECTQIVILNFVGIMKKPIR